METDLLTAIKRLRDDARLLSNNLDDIYDDIYQIELRGQLKDQEIEKLKAANEKLKAELEFREASTQAYDLEQIKENLVKQRKQK